MFVRRQYLYLAALFFHFTLIGTVSVHDLFWLFKNRVVAGSAPLAVWKVLDAVPAVILGDESPSRTPWQKILASYTNAAGIDAGYGCFAPNIPPTHALVFECHYSGDRVEYDTPSARSAAAQLRLVTLIEEVGRADYEPWRNELVRLLARSTWRLHPDTESMRAFLGTVTPPTVAEYRAGKEERTFRCQYVYDFPQKSSSAKRSSP